MAGDAEQPQPRTGLGLAVMRKGKDKGLGILEAVAHVIYHIRGSDLVVEALRGSPQPHILGKVDPRNRERVLEGLLSTIARDRYDLKAVLLEEMAGGAIALVGTHTAPPGAEAVVTSAALTQGELDLATESLTDHRIGRHYESLRLVPRAALITGSSSGPTPRQRLSQTQRARARAVAFTAALDAGELEWSDRGKGERSILTTRQDAYRHLSVKHPGLFGTLETFKKGYGRKKGRWVGDIPFPITWASDHNNE